MKIESLKVKNFRSIKEAKVVFDDYSALIGANGAGKSSFITALNIFFFEDDLSVPDKNYLEKTDFTNQKTKNPIEIKVTFGDLSLKAEEDFSHYLRHKKLIVSAIARYDEATGRAKIERFGSRLGLEIFIPFHKADKKGALVADLKEIYNGIKKANPKLDLPAPVSKLKMIESMRECEKQNREQLVEIPSSDLFEGFTKGNHKFQKHIQYLCVPAVKDITSEQFDARNSSLKRLLNKVVLRMSKLEESLEKLKEDTQKKHKEILDSNREVLANVERELSERIKIWASPESKIGLEWRETSDTLKISVPNVSVIASDTPYFSGPLHLFGHGFQRSFFLALLQTLAEIEKGKSPSIFLACEEPELFQHPPQIKHLAETLEEFASRGDQVLVATHSPLLINAKGFESVRLVKKGKNGRALIKQTNYESFAKREKDIRGVEVLKPEGVKAFLDMTMSPHFNEIFFSKFVILVEGREDYAYLVSYLKFSDNWKNYRKYGCHIILGNGKDRDFLRAIIISQLLEIPFYPIWDTDTPSPNGNHQANKSIFKALIDEEKEKITKDMITDTFTAWKIDLRTTVRNECGESVWDRTQAKVISDFNLQGVRSKTPILIGYVLDELWKENIKSKSLLLVCDKIIEAAKKVINP